MHACMCIRVDIYILACLKLLNFFTTLLHFSFSLASQSIEYHRLRQARGEGHDTHPTLTEQGTVERRKSCSSSPRFQSYPMSFDVHYLTECLVRTSILPNIHPSIHGQYFRSRKTCVEEKERERKNACSRERKSQLRNSCFWCDRHS